MRLRTVDLAVPERALAIGAHPDDVEFGCGATLAKWSRLGCEAHLLVLTDGSKGTWDPTADLRELIATRAREQALATEALGVAGVHFLGRVDGELEHGLDTRAEVCAWIRRIRPQVVLAHDPWKRYRLHPDHHHAGLLALDGIAAARDPHFFPEQPDPPYRPDHALLFEAEEIHHLERVDADIAAKAAALFEHRSQWRSTHGIDVDAPDAEAQRDAFVAGLHATAAEAALLVPVVEGRPCHRAEAFARMDDL